MNNVRVFSLTQEYVMNESPKLLILDSGVGGLSVAKEIMAIHPFLNITCVADNAAYPYGDMPDHKLTTRLLYLVNKFKAQINPDIIVIACNTASTIALDALRAQYNTPFIGVVPAIKPGAQQSKTKAIGVLATPATIQRPYTYQLIEEFASDVSVSLFGSLELVHAAEALLTDAKSINSTILAKELEPILNSHSKIDTVVLACTHFPLLKQSFSSLKGFSHINWVDSGRAIANRVTYWLDALSISAQKPDFQNFSFIFTKKISQKEYSDDKLSNNIAKYIIPSAKQTKGSLRYSVNITVDPTPHRIE